MYHCGMRQVEERHVANKVDLMVWSDRLDLLALSNFKGDVQVHRLHWQKVWSLPPPNESDLVTAIAWRPDGKALAIAYSSGWVLIIDIEDKEVLDKFHLEQINKFGKKSNLISCMKWLMKAEEKNCKIMENIYEDASIFLPKPSSLNSESKTEGGSPGENIKNFKDVKEQTQLNILVIGYGVDQVHMRAFGSFPLGFFDLGSLIKEKKDEFRVMDINLTDDFSAMQIICMDTASDSVIAVTVNTSMLSAYSDDILSIANKHSQILHLILYMDHTMASINEAWETILLEMDKKMSDYAASVPEGGVSADFLELLMLGAPSVELEVFLLKELTAKGLKKFGSSVEMSYSAIQKLVLKQLNIVGQSLMYYLCELRGFTRVPDRYKIMDIQEGVVTESIKAGFAFLNKCLELQQVIDSSMHNYKAFFRWLFVVIVRLLDEQTPSEIVKITQQDQMHIAEFLYSFDNAITGEAGDADRPVKFNLERLGQYLQNQELKILPDNDDNPWHKFLNENPCFLQDNETIFHPTEFKKYSLVQQQKHLKNAIDKVFDISSKDFRSKFPLVNCFKCYENHHFAKIPNDLKVSQVYDAEEKRFLFAILSTRNVSDGLFFMSINNTRDDKKRNMRAIKYYFTQKILPDSDNLNQDPVTIIDAKFYSSKYLSVLITHPQAADSSIFVQLPVKIAVDNANVFDSRACEKYRFPSDKVSSRDISPLLDQGHYKVLDKMDGLRMSVSGGRKVAVVLSKSNRKVRVFEMEVDVEDENDEDVTPQSLRSDASIISPNKSALNVTDSDNISERTD